MARKTFSTLAREYNDNTQQRHIIFNQIVAHLSAYRQISVDELQCLNMQENQALKQALTQLYREQYELLTKSSSILTAHLKKRYTKAYDDFADEFHIHYTDVRLTPWELAHLIRKKRELPNNDLYPRMMFPLINQVAALLRANKHLFEPRSDTEEDLLFYRQRVLNTHLSLTQNKITTKNQRVSDINTIRIDRSPATRLFIKIFHIVSSALIIGVGFTIARAVNAYQTRGHCQFWQPRSYDYQQALLEVENNLLLSEIDTSARSINS